MNPDNKTFRVVSCGSMDRWIFTQEQLYNTPSRPDINYESELRYRKYGALFLQDIGQRLSLPQLCINTAIVYMQRFYMFHSMMMFHWTSIAPAALELAAKALDHHRKLEDIINVARFFCSRQHPELEFKPLKTDSDLYENLHRDLILNENLLLSTLGFQLEVEHPHVHVINSCQLLKLEKTAVEKCAYLLANSCLHLTTLCLQYEPSIVACFCIHLAGKYLKREIAPNSEEQPNCYYEINRKVTLELLDRLTSQFSHVLEKAAEKSINSIREVTQGRIPTVEKEEEQSGLINVTTCL